MGPERWRYALVTIMAVDYPIPPWLTPQAAQGYGELAGAAHRAALQAKLEREKMAQQAAQAAMQMQARQQELAANMQARAEAMRSEAMREDQKLRIEKAYKDSVLGIQQQELDIRQKTAEHSIKQAAASFAAKQEAGRRIAAGEDPQKVWMELGPTMGITGNAMANLSKKPFEMGSASDIEGLPGFKQIQTGPETRRIVRLPPNLEGMNTTPTPVVANGKVIGYNIPRIPGTTFRGAPKENKMDALLQQAAATKGGSPAVQSPTAAAAEAIRMVGDRRAAFDAQTKNFIRWLDPEPELEEEDLEEEEAEVLDATE